MCAAETPFTATLPDQAHHSVSGPVPEPDTAGTHANGALWRQLHYLNCYRLLLAGLFLFASTRADPVLPLGNHDPQLFFHVTLAYLAFSLLAIATIHWRRPPFRLQAHIQILADIAVITLLMYASGGVYSGLGMLLVVAIAGGSLLMEGRTALLFAAIATLAVLGEQAYSKLEGHHPADYTQAGLLGAAFFATAILAHSLARRLRESEALAQRRGVDLANMAQLTEYIIQRMQTGILVVDREGHIRLINRSAQQLLGTPQLREGQPLEVASPRLAALWRRWQDDPQADGEPLQAERTGVEILPRCARLGQDDAGGTLLFLEDTAALAQQAQQMKLASLGRLAASIAHEIRNPLGAIAHAGQLLAESPHLDASDLRLTEIIQNHSRRVNTIIENVMRLGRRDRSHPEELVLEPWLEQFVMEFCLAERIEQETIRLEVHPSDTCIRADAGQLRQVLWNLCHNALQHGIKQHGNQDGPGTQPSRATVRVQLRAGLDPDFGQPFLEIVDDGPGIAPEMAEHIFDPFFTTAEEGTGLGLYIARELCESNQARLQCLPCEHGARFRITFTDPRRRQVA